MKEEDYKLLADIAYKCKSEPEFFTHIINAGVSGMIKAEKFAKLNGICIGGKINSEGICLYCGECIESHKIPTFTDAKSILEVMMKREDWVKFGEITGRRFLSNYTDEREILIELNYILNPDKLLDEAIKFCEEGGKC